MEPEQSREIAPEATQASTKSKASSSCGLIGHVAKLMGKTAGLAQNTGVKTADSLLSVSRQAGRLLHVPSKLRSMVSHGPEKKQEREFDFEIERLHSRIERLYSRIGERICHSPLIDRSGLSTDPQLEALVSTVRDLEIEVTDLRQRDQSIPVISHRPIHGGPVLVVEQTEAHPGGGAQVGESAPSPAPQADNAPPSGAE